MRRACARAGIAYGMGLNDGAVVQIIRHSTTAELIVNQKLPIPTVMKITGPDAPLRSFYASTYFVFYAIKDELGSE